jgi:2',3'-cyclic-nucleotide 2'-phosphodiesterase (5'-nucleotidase family)
MCGSKEYHIVEKGNKRIGFVGLAEKEWVMLMPEKRLSKLYYEDYLECAQRMHKKLKEEEHCDIIIALTHMRTHNDQALVDAFGEFDMVLGGHDHVLHTEYRNNSTYILKSGCEFREFCVVDLTPKGGKSSGISSGTQPFIDSANDELKDLVIPTYREKFSLKVHPVQVTSKWKLDPVMAEHVNECQALMKEKYGMPLF